MQKIYEKNGLMFRNEREINLRESFVSQIKQELEYQMKIINRGFDFVRVEASQITPIELIDDGYTGDDIFLLGDDLVMRPETTMGSYEYAKVLLNKHHKPKHNMPLVIRQHGKSFRKEQDKVVANMRLKEFHQLEFQMIYSTSTEQDYHTKVVDIVHKTLSKIVGECNVVESDRLPNYSQKTTDIELAKNNMELASISLRKDFDGANVVEVAIGTDRLLYNYNN